MNLIKLADFFGVFNKTKDALQGKKTYITSAIKAVTALSVMFTTLGTMFGVLAQILTEALSWVSGGASFGQLTDTVTVIVQQHTVLVATFTASFWALMDAFSDAAKYAGSNRRHKELMASDKKPLGPAF